MLRNNTRFAPVVTRARLVGRSRAATLSLALATVPLAVIPATLLAHARLVRSEPAAGAKGVAPTRIRLFFSEEPVVAMTRLHLVGAAGDTVELSSPRVDSSDAHVLIADVTGRVGAGGYTLTWSTAARDGHASKGSFSFSVEGAAPSGADTASKSSAAAVTARVDSEKTAMRQEEASDSMQAKAPVTVAGVLTRLLGYASIFLIVGAVIFKTFVLPRAGAAEGDALMDVASTNAATLGMVASVGSLIATILKLVQESSDMPEIGMPAMAFSSAWGWSLIVAAIAAVFALFGFWRAHSAAGTSGNSGWRIALIAAVPLVVAPAFGGHAIASDQAWLAVPADIIHVGAGSVWLGTLTVIIVVGISAALKTSDSSAGSRIASFINVFSPMALVCGAAVVITGVTAAFIHVPRLGAFLTSAYWYTSYGSALYRKLVFVVLLMLVGAWNFRRTKPRLSRDGAVTPLRRVATLEIVLATVVLGLTSILVALAMPQ